VELLTIPDDPAYMGGENKEVHKSPFECWDAVDEKFSS
jgi:hypothetical protein